MRVKCISVKDSFLMEYKNVTVGKDYEVIGVSEDYSMGTDKYTIVDDNGLYFSHGISIFRLIKEDKMEAKVVRKWEDLIGMENGFGLTIDENLDVVRKGFHGYYLRKEELFTFEGYLGSIKCMGFKFDYKPLRTVHEVIQEIKSLKSLTFKQGKLNYFVSCYEGKYHVEAMRETFIIGVNYMTKEQAQKYADELNEIIGVEK